MRHHHRWTALGMVLFACGCFTPPERGSSYDPYRDSLDAASTLYVERTDGPTSGERLAWYLPDRFLDLIDIIDLQLAAGPGVGVELHLTKFLWAKTLNLDAYNLGFEGRRVGVVRDRHVGEWRLGPLHDETHEASRISLSGTRSTYEEPAPTGVASVARGERHPADLAVSVHLLLVGLTLAFKPAELVDFIGGWFTWDPMADDLGTRVVELRGARPPVHTIDRFLQALDNLEFKSLRSCLTRDLWVNTWVKTPDGGLLAGRRYEEQKASGMVPDGSVKAEVSPIDNVASAVMIDTVLFQPEAYRDPTDRSFSVRFELTRVKLRHGVPELFWGKLVATRGARRWVDTFDVRLRIEGHVWKIDRFSPHE